MGSSLVFVRNPVYDHESIRAKKLFEYKEHIYSKLKILKEESLLLLLLQTYEPTCIYLYTVIIVSLILV